MSTRYLLDANMASYVTKQGTSSTVSHKVRSTARRLIIAALLVICSRAMVAQEAEQLEWLPSAVEERAGGGASGRQTIPNPGLPAEENSQIPARNPQTPSSQNPASTSRSSGSGVIALLAPARSQRRLTAKDKFQIYVHQNFGPQDFILPAAGAGFSMMNPPPRYPRSWKDGGGAFGRWYGEQIAASTSNRTGQLLVEMVLHEDPRYVPSDRTNALLRTFHALGFTLVDKTDSGHNTFAFSNFAGAAAGGFVGMGFLPAGYNNATHAEQRALRGLASVAVRNIITEFRPEWAPVLRKIRVPSILPEWWTRKPPQPP